MRTLLIKYVNLNVNLNSWHSTSKGVIVDLSLVLLQPGNGEKVPRLLSSLFKLIQTPLKICNTLLSDSASGSHPRGP